MKTTSFFALFSGFAFLAVFGLASAAEQTRPSWLVDYPQEAQSWYASGEQKIAEKLARFEKMAPGKAKNIILFVGDGMGVSTVTAGRIFAGQQLGMSGEEYELAFDKFPFSGLSRTYNTNQQTPDSAGTMTAIIAGVKTKAGIIGVDDNAQRGECNTQKNHGLLSALELAEIAGMSTGIVSTARITHATPAATYASAVERDWENDSELNAGAKAMGCEDIASQLVNFAPNLKHYLERRKPKGVDLSGLVIDGPEVILGGGAKHFFPAQTTQVQGREILGKRGDGRNLVAQWQHANPQGRFVMDKPGLQAADKAEAKKIFGLFSQSHMAYEGQRQNETDNSAQPSLAEMTAVALNRLQNNNRGYFLMVEAGRIDHAHHANSAYNALLDTVALSQAVDVAVSKTRPEDTLIIVTADHSHVFVMAGYPARGNPILGKVGDHSKLARDLENRPYTTLGYMNGPGFDLLKDNYNGDARYQREHHSGRANLEQVDTTNPGYHQETLVPLESETHGGEDVAIYAQGPGAWLLSGSNEQHVIFHAMNYSGNLVGRAQAAIKGLAE